VKGLELLSEEIYDSQERFISYWNQIKNVTSFHPKSILEIGVGNGFVSSYLRKRGFNLTTIDISDCWKPNVKGALPFLPFKNNQFELCLCSEVLEHLPFSFFKNSLIEIYRVTMKKTVLSLPDSSEYLGFNIIFPLKIKPILLTFPKIINRTQRAGGVHLWEIGKKGYELKKINEKINESGFNIENTYRIFENPYHRFFVLSK
jgi:hypothetical protein